ncbi:MAG: sulfurtransferase [Alphaproteobacteria bacterium]|nr:sulfurtransferase [Alphaproteobacteria bacterium]
MVFIDLRAKAQYLKAHVPGAVHSDYVFDGWREERDGVVGLMPCPHALESVIGRLGVSNDSHVVLLPPGASAWDMGIATRIYWTFKVLGHNAMSILNGGMKAYLAEDRSPREDGEVAPRPARFIAEYQPLLVADCDDVSDALRARGLLLDSRPTDQYLGLNKTGDVQRYGTLPGAVSIPGQWLTINGGGYFRGVETLRRLYQAVNVPLDPSAILFCNTGHWSTVGWFAHSELLGLSPSRMYDASMAEWSRADPQDRPMEIKVPVD